MNLQKLNPWNWFRHEDRQRGGEQVPVAHRHSATLVPAERGGDPLYRLHQEMDRLFDQVFTAFGWPSAGGRQTVASSPWVGEGFFQPQLDVAGDDKCYEITLDVPGLKGEDLSIEVGDEVLTVRGSKEEKKESRDKHYYRVERCYGDFQRTLSLPDDVDREAITARLTDGVLRLTLPRKAVPEKAVRRIPVST